jgi:hypothetical protein
MQIEKYQIKITFEVGVILRYSKGERKGLCPHVSSAST